jgi:prophage antirepressor-like protein
MNEVAKVFNDKPVRMVVKRGEPWFVAKDACDILGLEQVSRAMDRLDQDQRGLVKVTHPQSPDKTIEMAAVTESGLYELVIRSDKPEAKAFRKWITSEVLPSIRKTGQYSVSAEARKESSAARSALCRQWQEHGADKFYHYINLTKAEYEAIFGDRAKKKADMTKEELGILMVFEAVEYLKLVKNPEVNGYRQLDDSLRTTARQLPLFTTMHIEGARA